MTPDLTGVRLVSWDVDGTLYSLAALKRHLLMQAIRRGLKERAFGSFRELRALADYHRAIERQRKSSQDARVDSPALLLFADVADQEVRWLRASLSAMAPSPKALRLMALVRQAGVEQVVLSDFDATEKLAALGLSRELSIAYACQSIGYWKPSPVPFHFVQQRHSVEPQHHLHIGDRLDTDGAGAERSGCLFHHLVG
jgi:phosphoglycolate phosphatase